MEASKRHDLVADEVNPDDFRTVRGVLVMALDRAADVLAQFLEGVGLGEDGRADRAGGEPAVRIFLDLKNDFSHRRFSLPLEHGLRFDSAIRILPPRAFHDKGRNGLVRGAGEGGNAELGTLARLWRAERGTKGKRSRPAVPFTWNFEPAFTAAAAVESQRRGEIGIFPRIPNSTPNSTTEMLTEKATSIRLAGPLVRLSSGCTHERTVS